MISLGRRLRFRDWWQPPRRARDRPATRQVTFLELFYDLVYVVLIAELSHALFTHTLSVFAASEVSIHNT
jgi:low temperature requirement protein LtrA